MKRNYQETNTKRGGVMIIFEGFTYTKDKTCDGFERFRCSDRSCRASGKLYTNRFEKGEKEHNHEAEREKIERKLTLAAFNALKFVSNGVQITGCYFLFAQAIWRNVADKGLKTFYNENKDFTKAVRRMSALPLLKVEDIDTGFDSVKELLVPLFSHDTHDIKIVQFLGYLENAWIKDGARFPRNLWNRFGTEGPRTNNNVEAWHSAFKREVGRAHPNIYSFISAIKADHDSYDTKLIQLRDGANPNPRAPRYKKIDLAIKGYIEKYDKGDLTVPRFLDHVGSFNKMRDRSSDLQN